MKTYVGTSGYSYQHWLKGVFYPKEWPKNKLLEYYCRHFDSVELNVTFYRNPNQKVFKAWFKKTPENFKFVVKGSRFITHIKKLNDTRNSIDIFFENTSYLKNKLACVLWQLPASVKYNREKLEEFINNLKKNKTAKRTLHSLEFRDKSWFNEEVYTLFRKHNINLCIADSGRWPKEEVITSNFLYLRFHGETTLYGSNYCDSTLKDWARKARSWLKKADCLFAFFNNDYKGFAVKNAEAFKELLK